MAHRENFSERWFGALRRAYSRSIDRAAARRGILLGVAFLTVATALVSLKYIGTEFMPKLDEGSILITSRKLPGIALTQSIDVSKEIAMTMRSFPEITSVVTKLGRPDVATEAMGIYESDSYLQLAPKDQRKCCRKKEELIEKLSEALQKIPGVAYTMTQPMEIRMDETVTGIRGDVAIKIFGDDLQILEELGRRTLAIVSSIPGAAEPQMQVTSGVAELQVRPRHWCSQGELASKPSRARNLPAELPLKCHFSGQKRPYLAFPTFGSRIFPPPDAFSVIWLKSTKSRLAAIQAIRTFTPCLTIWRRTPAAKQSRAGSGVPYDSERHMAFGPFTINRNYLGGVVPQWRDLRVDLHLVSLPADREDHMRARRSGTALIGARRNDYRLFGHRS